MAGRKRIKRSSGGRIDLGGLLTAALGGGVELDPLYADESEIGSKSFEQPYQSDTPFKAKNWMSKLDASKANLQADMAKVIGGINANSEIALLQRKKPFELQHLRDTGAINKEFAVDAEGREIVNRQKIAQNQSAINKDELVFGNTEAVKQQGALLPGAIKQEAALGKVKESFNIAEEGRKNTAATALADMQHKQALSESEARMLNAMKLTYTPENVLLVKKALEDPAIAEMMATMNANISKAQAEDAGARQKVTIAGDTDEVTRQTAVNDAMRGLQASQGALDVQPQLNDNAQYQASKVKTVIDQGLVDGTLKVVGGTLVDVNTGKPVFTAPNAATIKAESEAKLIAESNARRAGKPVDISGGNPATFGQPRTTSTNTTGFKTGVYEDSETGDVYVNGRKLRKVQ